MSDIFSLRMLTSNPQYSFLNVVLHFTKETVVCCFAQIVRPQNHHKSIVQEDPWSLIVSQLPDKVQFQMMNNPGVYSRRDEMK